MTTTEVSDTTVELTPISLAPLTGPRPLVSVLMANYNYVSYVATAIESVIGQSYSNWELIVCDDGSSDASVDVVERYVRMESRVRLIVKRNGGHASALNAAYAICGGEIICLLDSDDVYARTKIESVVNCCLEFPDRGLIAHRVIRVNQRRTKEGVWPLLNALPEGWLGVRLLGEGGILPFLPPSSGLSLRRGLSDRLFPMPTVRPLGACPDQIIVRLAPLITSIGSVDKALAEYRLHAANSYGASRVTVPFLDRETEFGKALWNHQHTFLSQISPSLAAKLKPVTETEYFSFIEYLRAKLGRERSAKVLHQRYMTTLKQVRRNSWSTSFWRWSFYLPAPVFDFTINLFLGQNILKRAIARLKGFA
ncbi:MAG TPA: glycosyltransferase family 2 protein [Edaphobacter sp.]|nr:glycosyltransferase family 2 protein [Edaphobacter sp.]